MNLEEIVSRYIGKAERIFSQMKLSPSLVRIEEEKIESIVEEAKRYLEDAKYYQGRNKLETSLASVAYCEGLLDALRLLEVVEFSW